MPFKFFTNFLYSGKSVSLEKFDLLKSILEPLSLDILLAILLSCIPFNDSFCTLEVVTNLEANWLISFNKRSVTLPIICIFDSKPKNLWMPAKLVLPFLSTSFDCFFDNNICVCLLDILSSGIAVLGLTINSNNSTIVLAFILACSPISRSPSKETPCNLENPLKPPIAFVWPKSMPNTYLWSIISFS